MGNGIRTLPYLDLVDQIRRWVVGSVQSGVPIVAEKEPCRIWIWWIRSEDGSLDRYSLESMEFFKKN
jgi:hypothetical protein